MSPRGHKNRCFTTIFVARTFLVQNLLQNLKFGAKAEKSTILKLYKRNFKRKMESAKNGKNHQNLLQNQIYFRCQSRKKSVILMFFEKKFGKENGKRQKRKKTSKTCSKTGRRRQSRKKYDFEVCLKGI